MKKLIIFTLILTMFACVDVCDYIYFNDQINVILMTFTALFYLAIIIVSVSKKIHRNRPIERMFH